MVHTHACNVCAYIHANIIHKQELKISKIIRKKPRRLLNMWNARHHPGRLKLSTTNKPTSEVRLQLAEWVKNTAYKNYVCTRMCSKTLAHARSQPAPCVSSGRRRRTTKKPTENVDLVTFCRNSTNARINQAR